MSKVIMQSMRPGSEPEVLVHADRNTCKSAMSQLIEQLCNQGHIVRGCPIEVIAMHKNESPCLMLWIEFSEDMLMAGQKQLEPFFAEAGIKLSDKDGPKRG